MKPILLLLLILSSPVQAKVIKQPVWKGELGKVLKGLFLNPIPSLAKDTRCQIDIKAENLLEELCDAYLSEKDIKAMALTVRLARGLRCLSQTQVVMLSRRVGDYIQTLSAKKSSPQGLACMANVAILLNDMFPNQKQAPLWNTFQTYGADITRALAQFENKEVGLWCSDHTGGAIQFKGRTEKSVRPVSAMIEALENPDRMRGLDDTICGCQEIVANGFFCRHGMVPCPGGGEGDQGEAEGGEEEASEAGSEPPPGEPRGDAATRIAQEANQSALEQITSLLNRSCSENGGGMADAVGNTLFGGDCFQQAADKAGSELSRSDQLKTLGQCLRESEVGQSFRVSSPDEVFMDSGCGVMDRGSQDPPTVDPDEQTRRECERDPTSTACAHIGRERGQGGGGEGSTNDACRGQGVDRQRCEEARRQGQQQLNSPQSQAALQQQCRRVGGSNCSPQAIQSYTRQGEQVARNNSRAFLGSVLAFEPLVIGRGGNAPQSQRGASIGGEYDPDKNQITMNAGCIYNPNCWAHESYHATADAGGFDAREALLGCSGTAIDDCICPSNGSCEVMESHYQMERSGLPYRHQPCPDCPDNCSANDVRNNPAFQCVNEEVFRDPNSPEANPQAHVQQRIFGRYMNPLPDSSGGIDNPAIAAAVGASVACAMGNRRAPEMGDGCGTRMQPTPDNPDCAPLFQARTRDFDPNSSLCRQIDCSVETSHPCCETQSCPEGEEPVPGPSGIECRPATPHRGPSGPSPDAGR